MKVCFTIDMNSGMWFCHSIEFVQCLIFAIINRVLMTKYQNHFMKKPTGITRVVTQLAQ